MRYDIVIITCFLIYICLLYTSLPPGEEGTDSPAVVDDIDGEPFIDDDGSGYIFWRRRNAGRLSADRLHLDGEPVALATARQGYSEGCLLYTSRCV